MKNKTYYFFIVIISTLYFFLRFNHFTQNFVFRPDQGLHLLESYQMVENHKFRLLGPIVSSKNFDNRNFFIGANYYYALAFLGVLSKWNPMSMTVLYGVFEFAFIILFILWLRKKTSSSLSIFIFSLIALSPYLISHSRFYWNPHFLLPLSILEIVIFDKYLKTKNNLYVFLASFIWGFAFAFHYAAILWGIFYLYFFIKERLFAKYKIYFLIILGFILGDLPYFISELRHNFYNFKTIFFVYSHSNDSSRLYLHYFVYPFVIFVLFLLAYLFNKTQSKLFRVFLILFLLGTILLPPVDELSSIKGWRYPDQLQVLNLILQSKNCQKFNVAETISGDTQSYDLRSLLTVAKFSPDTVDNYPKDQTIFLIAPPTRPPESETVWEISSFKPFKVTEKIKINDQVIFYRLDKS